MTISGGLIRPQATVEAAQTKKTTNIITPVVAGDEFSHVLTVGVIRYSIRVRGSARLQIADATGETSTKFWTVRKGTVETQGGLDIVSLTLFMECSKASEVVEIIEWT